MAAFQVITYGRIWVFTEVEAFFVTDLKKLHDALRACGRASTFVSQDERDQLFIRAAGLTETP